MKKIYILLFCCISLYGIAQQRTELERNDVINTNKQIQSFDIDSNPYSLGFESSEDFLDRAVYASKQDAINGIVSNSFHRNYEPQTNNKSKAIFFSEDFEGGIGNWNFYDEDGDTYNWFATGFGMNGGQAIASESWKSGVGSLTPDNWMVSNAIDLSSADASTLLDFYRNAQDQIWPSEVYSVYISTSGNTVADFTGPNGYVLLDHETVIADGWSKRSISLSDYVGGIVYIAFRNHDCTDMFQLVIDDILIYEKPETDVGITTIITPNNNTGCGLAIEDVAMTIVNYSGLELNNYEVSYTINGADPVTEIITTALPAASSIDFTFDQTANLSTLGYYDIVVSIVAADDVSDYNNSDSVHVTNGDAYITVDVSTDGTGNQSWVIVNSSQDTIAKHIAYQWNLTNDITRICLIDDDCYKFSWEYDDFEAHTNDIIVSYNEIEVDSRTSTVDYEVCNIGGNCIADFLGSSVLVCQDEIINFIDESTILPTSWFWDFGDGNSSIEQNPNYAYTDAGTYTVVLTATNDDSFVETKTDYITVNLITIASLDQSDITVCEGESVNYSVTATGSNLLYQWQLNGVDILGATTYTYDILNASTEDAGIYSCIVTGDCGVVTISSVLTVNILTSVSIDQLDFDICAEEDITLSATGTGTNITYQWQHNSSDILGAMSSTYLLSNIAVSETGTYTCIVSGECGTESDDVIITVNPIYNVTDVATICDNETFEFGTQTLTAANAGENTEVFQTVNACDSTVVLTLTVNPTYNVTDVATICDNETFEFGTQTLTAANAGENTEVFTSVLGCDSTVVLTLTVNPTYNVTDVATICDNETFTFGTQTLTAANAGENTEVFQTVNACDSTVVLTLTVNPTYNVTDVATICDNETFEFGTQTLTAANAGENTEVFTSVSGCDSTVVLTLTVNPTYNVTDVATICDNETFTFGTQTLTAANAGENTEVFQTVNACDSTVVLTLTVNPTFEIDEVATICDGDTYLFGGIERGIAGVYVDSLLSGTSCDSIIILTLTVNPVYDLIENVGVCPGEDYIFPDGTPQTNIISQVVYTSNMQTTLGCDSIIETTVNVNPVYELTENVGVCPGEDYIFPDGMTQTNIISQVVYTSNMQTTLGCDSIIETTVDVNPVYSLTDNVVICVGEDYLFPDGNTQTNITSQVVYTSNIQTVLGCDSIIETTVDVNPVYSLTDNVVICAGEDYLFPDGNTQTNITSQVVYTSNLQTTLGCDSIIETTVYVNPVYELTENVGVCPGEDYIFPDGMTQTNIISQVVYTSNMQTTLGCDSIIETTVDVNPVYDLTENVGVCPGEDYIFPDGTTQSNITTQVVYTSNIQTVLGCDSIIETTVDVNPVYSLTDNVVICVGEDYLFPDGNTQTNITSQVVYTSNMQTLLGCDSIIETTVDVNIVDVTVNEVGITLTANVSDAIYQWIDCDNNNEAILGEESQSFTPSEDGNYAVIIDDGICSDTSDCYLVVGTEVKGIQADDFEVYPNPTTGIIHITNENGESIEKLELFDIKGQKIISMEVNDTEIEVDLSSYSDGVYFVKFVTRKAIVFEKLILERD